MKTFQFKTNINCGKCIAGVTPFLNKVEGIKWNVDTDHPDKILTIDTERSTEEEIVQAVKKAGFTIEKLNN